MQKQNSRNEKFHSIKKKNADIRYRSFFSAQEHAFLLGLTGSLALVLGLGTDQIKIRTCPADPASN